MSNNKTDGYRTLSYRRLMQMVDDGRAEICAWTQDGDPVLADAIFYKNSGASARRERVAVINIPTTGE